MNGAIDSDAELYYLNIADKDQFVTPEKKFEYKELLQMVKEVKREFRIPFEMHYNGYKYHEIAEKLSLPLGTVKTRIFYARKELKRMVEAA